MHDVISVRLGEGRSYEYYVDCIAALGHHLERLGFGPGRCLVVTDENVACHWLSKVKDTLHAWDLTVVVLPAGEESKSVYQLQLIYDKVLGAGVDRQTPVVALGGGVVGDLAGFAAATLLRGLPLVHVPTSLIAQVDSAIGGKTSINHAVGKNLIGAFYQPKFILSDPALISTLPDLEWDSGLAEVVKHALIADVEFVTFLEASWEKIRVRDPETIRRMISWAASVKAGVVSRDEKELGYREVLNFGHTFAHAIEREAGYGRYTHGEAVALGMRAAVALSGRLHKDFASARAHALVRRIPVRYALDIQGESLVGAMQYDKKVRRGVVRVILLRALGHAYGVSGVSRADLLWALDVAAR